MTRVGSIRMGIAHLRIARDLFKEAGAPKTTDRVRLALTSAGALRHAEAAPWREERQRS